MRRFCSVRPVIHKFGVFSVLEDSDCDACAGRREGDALLINTKTNPKPLTLKPKTFNPETLQSST